jgi:anthranilate synthase/aminodeoxychorismate synthase-like glutamine amidotransferase
MKKILLIDFHDSFTYNLAAMFGKYKDVKLTISYPSELNNKIISEFDKIIFSPGPGLPSEYPIFKQIIEDFKSTKHFLGVCLGHQAICEHFGAKLKNYSLPDHGVNRKLVIKNQNSVLFKGVSDLSEIGVYHSWFIDKEEFPVEMEITAENESGIIMAAEHKLYDIQSVQFHPESFITQFGNKMIGNWLRN